MAIINGNNGSNTLAGTDFADIINGLGGRDNLFGGDGLDILNGGNGRDTLDGGAGNDTLDGGRGRDRLIGGEGNDEIIGGDDVDTLVYTGNLSDYIITQNADGSFVIQDTRNGSPDGTDLVRTVEQFEFADGTYSANDLLTDNQTAREAVNEGPAAGNDAASVDEDDTVIIDVLANDTDANSDPLTVTGASAGNGTVVVNANNTLTYSPNADFNGSDTITYTIDDGYGGTDTASVTVTVAPANDAPSTLELSAATLDENDAGAVVGNLTTEDVDAGDNHTYTVSDDRFEVAGGQLKLKDGISLDFDTEPSVDVTLTSTDSGGLSVDRTFTIAVNDLGDATPVAVDDAAETVENVSIVIDILANDSDADGDALTITAASVSNGTIVINSDNTITYTPNPNYVGSDTIAYTVSDGYGGEDSASVLLTINQANEVPDPTDDDAGESPYGTPLVVQAAQLLANDVDDDGDVLSVLGVHDAQNGTVSMDASGNITFTPDAGFSGNTSFKYTVTDGIDSVGATVNLYVEVDFSDYTGNWSAEVIDLSGSPLPCFIDCGRGNDTLLASNLRDAIIGGLGDDDLNGGGGDDDFLVGLGHGFDRFNGGSGYDKVKATAENVKIGLIGDFDGTVEEFTCAGFENVSITGTWQWQVMDFSNVTLRDIAFIDAGFGNDTVTGSTGDDVIIGNKGDDILNGGEGDDDFMIRLGDGFDTFDGGDGYDQILADGDNVTIGILNDFINAVEEITANGNAGVSIAGKWYAQSFDFSNTVLDGITQIDLDGGDDTVVGSTGADTIIGGRGNDTLSGHLGADTFVFRNYEGQDVLKDFTIGDDVVRLEGVAGFASFSDVQASLSQEGAAARLTFNNDHSILFENTLVSALTSDQFEFA